MYADLPDERGYFGSFGGCYAPEILMQYMLELNITYANCKADTDFQKELRQLLAIHAGRETPLYLAEALTWHARGARIYLKREDLTSTGSHHINSALGQALIAGKMGKSLLLSETSTGLHGIAVARAAAIMGLDCHLFIGASDYGRQPGCVEQIQALGAEITIVEHGNASLLEANEAATRAWLGVTQNGFYVVNSIIGPHPYPLMVRDFQSPIGEEVKRQMLSATGSYPDHLVACVGSGSNAMGLFYPFLDSAIALTGVAADGGDGLGSAQSEVHRCGVFQGVKTMMRQDKKGQLASARSVAVGLQSCVLGPEFSFLQSSGRISHAVINDREALGAYKLTRELESITPALESAHAIAWGLTLAATLTADKNIVINLSGRGEKDAGQISKALQTCREQ